MELEPNAKWWQFERAQSRMRVGAIFLSIALKLMADLRAVFGER